MTRINNILALAFLILLAAPSGIQAQPNYRRSANTTVRKTRKQLLKENQAMRLQIDSLKNDINAYQNDKRLNDSLMNEMMSAYDENSRSKSAAGLNPEDYTPEISDSLLSVWYVHNQIKNSREGNFDMDRVHFSSNTPDKVYIERLAKMNSYITLPFNETVRNYIILYSEKMPTKMGHILGLCRYYMPIFEETFDKYGLPKELKYLAIVESALNPVAVSRANAKGIWQFMFTSARQYGLEISSFVDERFDPFKSADAAARYLRDAYSIFGDWNLAISSYNCGSGNVMKAIKRAGGKRDFWSVYPYLPRETRGYVPAFVGAMYAITYQKECGLVPEKLALPAHVDTFEIHKMLHFKQVNELVGVPTDDLHNLNPQYFNDIIPGTSEKPKILRIPYNFTNAFIENEDSVYTYKAKDLFSPAILQNISEGGEGSSGGQSRVVYTVKKGDYLGRIASRYHVSINDIKKWNHLRSNNLRVGQRLYIYKAAPASKSTSTAASASKAATPKAAAPADTASKASPSPQARETAPSSGGSTAAQGGGTVTYTVKKGDTLYSIASQFPGVSANDIMKYNGISSKIKVGQKIKIPSK